MGAENIKEALADETDSLVREILERGVDAVVGGFPCQDISYANPDGSGLAGTRSGLFWEMARTVRMVRPSFWLVENVVAILRRGMAAVLKEMASSGYDAEWDCISAASVGAPHFRARTYILAYLRGTGGQRLFPGQVSRQPEFSWCKDVRRLEDMQGRLDIPEPLVRRGSNGVKARLHGIGNGNPPCVIREIMKNINHSYQAKGMRVKE